MSDSARDLKVEPATGTTVASSGGVTVGTEPPPFRPLEDLRLIWHEWKKQALREDEKRRDRVSAPSPHP